MTQQIPPSPAATGIPGHVAENLRAENDALNSYGIQVVAFRFTVFSFLLAAIGLVLSADKLDAKGLVLIGLVIPPWLLDIRNRVLLGVLNRRGREIESFWRRASPQHFRHAYHAHGEDIRPVPISVLGVPLKVSQNLSLLWFFARHGFAVDLLVVLVVAYGLWLIQWWACLPWCGLWVVLLIGSLVRWCPRFWRAPRWDQQKRSCCPICGAKGTWTFRKAISLLLREVWRRLCGESASR